MSTPPHILSVGANPNLMASRSLILRNAGYLVQEAYTVDKAINLVEQDSIDVALICHTIPKTQQNLLISTIRTKRRLMPILCIRSFAFETTPRNCVAVDNEPETLLKAVRQAITRLRPDSSGNNVRAPQT